VGDRVGDEIGIGGRLSVRRGRGRWGGDGGVEGGGVEGRVLDAVAVYFADVEVCAYFGDFGGGDVVGGAPDAFGGFVLG